MRAVKVFLLFIGLSLSFSPFAQEESKQSAFISDDLFVYMHAGAGKNYRILGTINAGAEIVLTGNESNEFSEIIDPKDRKTWIENKYISRSPSLRNVIAELNSKLAEHNETLVNTENLLSQANGELNQVTQANSVLTKQVTTLKAELTDVKSKLKHQDQEILTQWFFNGAMVLGFGFLLGVVIPRFVGKKRKAGSWA
ncbi:MAG: TIGR04211 family SH3 domain-containing protein [Thalassotalea sp.]